MEPVTPRKKKRPFTIPPADVPARRTSPEVSSVASEVIAAHGGDPIAAWHALHATQGPLAEAGGRADETAVAAAAGVGPEPRYELAGAPSQVSTLRVRVDVDGAEPPIWRRLDLAGDLTLDQVHTLLQAAFGWFDYHLHSFVPQVDGVRDRRLRPFPNDGMVEVADPDLPPEREVRLDQVLREVGERLFYDYDFGDGWEHTLVLESIGPRGADDPRATCLAGERAGPPEDIGGIARYNQIAAALRGGAAGAVGAPEVSEEEVAEVLDWLGEGFDPDDAALEEVDLDALLRAVEEAYATSENLLDNPRLSPAFAELVDRCHDADTLPSLAALVVGAGLDLTCEPPGLGRAITVDGLTPAEAEAVVAPWRRFLKGLGAQTAPPDPADAPRPAGPDRRGGRLARVALRLGMVRSAGGRLVPTRAARGASDPIDAWRLVAEHLTDARQEFERQACVLALLVAAAEPRSPAALASEGAQPVFRLVASELLALLGWRSEGRAPSGEDVLAWSEPVWTVLELAGFLTVEGAVNDAGRRLARTGLLASSP